MPDRRLTSDAGALLTDVIAGPIRGARVLAAFPSALYLAPEETRVVAIEASDGVGLPNALRLHRPAAGLDLGAVRVESTVTIGGGQARVADLVVTVERWVEHTYRPAGVNVELLRQRLDQLEAALAEAAPLEPPLAALVAALDTALASGELAEMTDAGRALVGLGDGLTPSGDDILCGLLSGGRTIAAACGVADLDSKLDLLGGALSFDAAERTTALSAALLWHAAKGELARPARAVFRALLGRTPLAPATAALLAVGHTSGQALAVGLVLGVRTGLAASSERVFTGTSGANG